MLSPHYWKHESTGALRPVIEKYLNHTTLTTHEVGLLKRYLLQWVHSPNWTSGPEMDSLR